MRSFGTIAVRQTADLELMSTVLRAAITLPLTLCLVHPWGPVRYQPLMLIPVRNVAPLIFSEHGQSLRRHRCQRRFSIVTAKMQSIGTTELTPATHAKLYKQVTIRALILIAPATRHALTHVRNSYIDQPSSGNLKQFSGGRVWG